MTFFEKNIQAIKNRDIVLYDQLQLKQEQLIDRVMCEPARDGNTYLKVLIHGSWVAFNSTYRPLAEAAVFAAKYKELPLFGRVLFLGFGNGYVAREMLFQFENRTEPGGDVVNASRKFAFYEPDVAVFSYVMQTYDLSDILGNENISIFVEGLNANLLPGWCSENVGNHNEGSFYLDALPKYKENYRDAYERLDKMYRDTLRGVEAYRNTKNMLAKCISKNNVFNMKYFEQAMNLKWFVENYPKNLPFVIVAAGPSLKQRVELLRQLVGRAFIMAVDTAACYLLEQGICPDGVICIDCRKDLYLFSREMQQIPFFLHTDVNHLVLDKVEPGFVYFVTSNMKYYEARAKKRNDYLLDLEAGGSVATMAFSFATALHVSDIILVGQDLAVRREESHVVSRIKRDMDAEQVIYVQGNEQEQVTTLPDFYIYLQWFQKEIARHSNIRVWNVTAGGARIDGATYVQPEELLVRFGSQDISYQEFNKRWQEQKRLHMEGAEQEQARLCVKTQYETIIEHINGLTDILKQGSELSKKLCGVCNEQGIETAQFAELNVCLEAISQQLCEIPEFEFLEGYCADMENGLLHNLYEEQEDKQTELMQIYSKLQNYYETLAKSVGDFIETLKEAMQ